MSEAVVVVGAGPVGLASALALAARGHDVLVVEAEPADRPRAGSRAIFVHRESLQLLEDLSAGLGRRIAADGLAWTIRRSTFRGRDVYRREYPPLPAGKLPPSTSLPQARTENLMLAACRQAGVRFCWGSPVTGVTVDDDGVTLVRGSGGPGAQNRARGLRARYVIAADGARSAVRTALGIELAGSRSEAPFVIVDVAELPEPAMPCERVFHYEHPAVDRRNVLLVPFAGGWRVDLQCREDDDPDEFAGPEGVRRWVAQVIDPRYAERVEWVSTYRFLQVLADRFADPAGRVLLVGEAAHLFAPFGARGMNSGIADAASAAAAVDLSLREGPEAGRAAVAAFAADRREAAEYNRAAARAALTHMQATQPLLRLKRRLAAAVAPRSVRAGTWLDTAPYGPRAGRVGAGGKY